MYINSKFDHISSQNVYITHQDSYFLSMKVERSFFPFIPSCFQYLSILISLKFYFRKIFLIFRNRALIFMEDMNLQPFSKSRKLHKYWLFVKIKSIQLIMCNFESSHNIMKVEKVVDSWKKFRMVNSITVCFWEYSNLFASTELWKTHSKIWILTKRAGISRNICQLFRNFQNIYGENTSLGFRLAMTAEFHRW